MEKYEKLLLFTEEELENQLEEGKIDIDFLIKYIVKINEVYNKLIDKVNEQDQIIREAIEDTKSKIIFWKKYSPDNTMEIRQLEGLLKILDRNVK